MKDKIWIGTDHGGINIFNKETNSFSYLTNNEKDNSSISSNAIYSLYTDNEGIVWTGNYNTGISFYNKCENQFEIIEPDPENANSLSYKIITCIFEDSNKKIWIGTDGGGLNRYEPEINRFTHFRHNEKNPNSIICDVIMSIGEDPEGNLWIGTYAKGLSVLDQKTDKFTHFTSQPGNEQTISHNTVWVVRHVGDSTMWIGTKGGVDIYNFHSKNFSHLRFSESDTSTISNNDITEFYADIYGYVWIGTHYGLNRYDPKTGKNLRFMPDTTNPEGIQSPVIRCITGANDGDLWIGTGSGQVLKHLPKTKAFISVLDDRFKFTNIAYMQEDSANNLWIATNKGICKFNYITKNYKIFYKSDGLVGDEFKRDAALISSSGKYYFGSNSGINVFTPNKIFENTTPPKVYITGFQIFNKDVVPLSHGSPLNQDVSLTKSITLSYRQSVFSFEFTAINYLQPERNSYAYMLEGFDNDWYYIGGKRSAMFTNISPGTYTFRVKAANNDGVWNNEGASIIITILPPWWNTLWFKLLIIIVLASILILSYLLRVAALKHQKQELELKVKQRTAELTERQEEILQQQEEIKSQKDDLHAQNKLLEHKNEEISIQKQELQKQNKTIETAYKNIKIISDFGQKVTSSLNLNDIQQMVYDYVSSLINVNAFGIGVYNESRALLEFYNFIELGQIKPYYFVKISDSKLLSVKCFLTKKVIVSEDITEEYQEYLRTNINIQHTPYSSVYIPLIIETREIGVLYVSSSAKNGFNDRDITNLKALSSYIAIAYDNAKAYKVIQLKNEAINGSIRYGLTIQKSMLVTEEDLSKYYESFILFMPKDIVSGDFYWFSQIGQSAKCQSHIQYIALVDCTGHGVPGAFMSMIGNRLLSEIVNTNKIYDPVRILQHLDAEVVSALMQNTSDNNDGMDIALVKIEKPALDDNKGLKLTFAGAKMPLFYYNSHEKVITKIDGSRKSIGGFESGYNKSEFSQKSIIVNKGDIIYLASDGIIDQGNGNKKKFGTKRLLEIFQRSAHLALSDQKAILVDALTEFMKGQDQRDDISVIGLKF
jgi:serine phosphatase RsbU (regulator of sigma subunit)/ligand-binding sensor domain-containing protein